MRRFLVAASVLVALAGPQVALAQINGISISKGQFPLHAKAKKGKKPTRVPGLVVTLTTDKADLDVTTNSGQPIHWHGQSCEDGHHHCHQQNVSGDNTISVPGDDIRISATNHAP